MLSSGVGLISTGLLYASSPGAYIRVASPRKRTNKDEKRGAKLLGIERGGVSNEVGPLSLNVEHHVFNGADWRSQQCLNCR
jgi:hypothetical protein